MDQVVFLARKMWLHLGNVSVESMRSNNSVVYRVGSIPHHDLTQFYFSWLEVTPLEWTPWLDSKEIKNQELGGW